MTAEWPSKASGNTLLFHSGVAWRIPPHTARTGASFLLVRTRARLCCMTEIWAVWLHRTQRSCHAHRSEHVQRSGLILMALNSPIVYNFTCWSCYFLKSFPYWELLVDRSLPRCACLGERGSTNGTGMCWQDVLSEGDRAGSRVAGDVCGAAQDKQLGLYQQSTTVQGHWPPDVRPVSLYPQNCAVGLSILALALQTLYELLRQNTGQPLPIGVGPGSRSSILLQL